MMMIISKTTIKHFHSDLLLMLVVDRFYIALFSALEQTHCACMRFYMSD